MPFKCVKNPILTTEKSARRLNRQKNVFLAFDGCSSCDRDYRGTRLLILRGMSIDEVPSAQYWVGLTQGYSYAVS